MGIALDAFAVVAVVILLLARRGRRGATAPRRRVDPRRHWVPVTGLLGTTALLLVVLALGATAAGAEGVADHLQCYKVTDAVRKRLKGVVDLDAPSIGVAPGCRLGRAKLYCVPAKARVQPGTLFDGSLPLPELPYHGQPAESDRVCYDVSCPASTGAPGDQTVTDRFGSRVLRRPTTEMVCTPATGGTLPPPASGFQIKTPPIEIPPYGRLSYCYYFRTPNTATAAVNRWVPELTPGTRSVVMFTTTNSAGQAVDRRPAGTVSAVDCQMFPFNTTVVPRWVYAGDTDSPELTLPADDGEGHPVAMEIPPNTAGFLMMHHVNPTAEPITTRVTVNAEGPTPAASPSPRRRAATS